MSMYPEEHLSEHHDNGTMPANVAALAESVVGHRISKCEKVTKPGKYYGSEEVTVITLTDGTAVTLRNTQDCCASTELINFLLHPDKVDHIIVGVGTTDGYTTWHIYADAGDVLELTVGWSAGNLGYYGYGFDIEVDVPPLEVPKFANQVEADAWMDTILGPFDMPDNQKGTSS